MADSSLYFDEDKSVKSQIKTELEDLKKMAGAFGPDRLRDGTWFNGFVQAMLSSYAETIIKAGGVEYFRKKPIAFRQNGTRQTPISIGGLPRPVGTRRRVLRGLAMTFHVKSHCERGVRTGAYSPDEAISVPLNKTSV
jgi:hypothetical protein